MRTSVICNQLHHLYLMELRSATHPHYYGNNKHVACWSTYDDLFKKKNEKLAVDRCLEATVAPWYTTGQTVFKLRPSSNLLRRFLWNLFHT